MDESQVKAIVSAVVDRYLTEGSSPATQKWRVAIGTDHGGVDLKAALKAKLQSAGHTVSDVGTHSKESVDYPDIAAAVARKVATGQSDFGIIIDGAGIGSTMAANKINGIRAALCYNEPTILNSRLHNNANVLCLGARFHSAYEAWQLVELWLSTEFEGGRHQKRIDKITGLE